MGTNNAEKDTRRIAIYTRKSKVTNKGDSIGVQFESCKEYAENNLNVDANYEYEKYSDYGKSGFYADRKEFQRLMQDISAGKIKTVLCYKLDRISRKMSDLSKVLEYLEEHNVTLWLCSNNISSQLANSKVLIQLLGVLAEFERDIIKERVQDNLIQLAEDGRWMGGTTPTGFKEERIKTGSGKNKNSYSYLVSISEEKKLVQEIFDTFLSVRCLNKTAEAMNKKGKKTKNGADFTILAVKEILSNPVYCLADEDAYAYFIERGCSVFGEIEAYNGKFGISVYNRTKQYKQELKDSTFLTPKFTQKTEKRKEDEWVIAVGKHEGFIQSKNWIEVQKLLVDIADKHNRPHRKTGALLAGIIYCPMCGKRLNVIPESGRFTNGKPRFKYGCPNAVRKGMCEYKAIRGVEIDEYVLNQIGQMSDKNSEIYVGLLKKYIKEIIKNDSSEEERLHLEGDIKALSRDIKAQCKNLRNAKEEIKCYIEEDIAQMNVELKEKKAELKEIEDRENSTYMQIKELEEIKTKILSYDKFKENTTQEEQQSSIKDVLERVYIEHTGDKDKCHIFIKGSTKEDYEEFFSHLEEEKKMCDLDKDSKHYSH
jgi:site-specific DNA recombinase